MAAIRFLALLVLLLPATVTAAAERPERIVSMNLCTDQLLMLLVNRARIASVSYLSAEPRSSVLAAQTRGLHLNHGLAEEVLPLRPDLVVAGTFTTRPTVFLLRKLGYPVVDMPAANGLDDIRANIRRLAAAVGETARGDGMIADFDARLADTAPPPGRRPLAALYWANGWTSGQGTLASTIVAAAGFRNLGDALGIAGTGQLPLETLLAAAPEVLITGRVYDGPARANEVFRHPALRRAFAGKPIVRVSDRFWVCGTPFVAEAIARLSEAVGR